jgi:hypothetical protein
MIREKPPRKRPLAEINPKKKYTGFWDRKNQQNRDRKPEQQNRNRKPEQ